MKLHLGCNYPTQEEIFAYLNDRLEFEVPPGCEVSLYREAIDRPLSWTETRAYREYLQGPIVVEVRQSHTES